MESPHSISADGTRIVFTSTATNLLGAGLDGNKHSDVFLHDTRTGVIIMVSRPSVDAPGLGIEGNGNSFGASISADGKHVVFISEANNLVLGDSNNIADVFLSDVGSGKVTRVNVDSSGNQALIGTLRFSPPVVNQDETVVAFVSKDFHLIPGDGHIGPDVLARDIPGKRTFRVSISDQGKELDGSNNFDPSISNDGSRIAFFSDATDIIEGRLLHPGGHFYVRDLHTSRTILVSQSTQGVEANSFLCGPPPPSMINGDGKRVTFAKCSTNLSTQEQVDTFSPSVFLRDLELNTTQLVHGVLRTDDELRPQMPAINHDGSLVTFSSDATSLLPGIPPGTRQVFVYQNVSLIAQFTIQPTADPFTFHLDSSRSHDADGTIVGYQWDFGDGNSSTDANPTHTYQKSGTYLIKLTVINNAHATDSTRQNVEIPDSATPSDSKYALIGGGLGCAFQDFSPRDLSQSWLSVLMFAGLIFLVRRLHPKQWKGRM